MRNVIKHLIVLIITVAFSVTIIFYSRKMAHPYIVQYETGIVNSTLSHVFPGYIIDKDNILLNDGGKFIYRTGITNSDGIDKKGFFFLSVIPGYYCTMILFAGIDENNNIIGIDLKQQPGALSIYSENPENITNESFSGIIKGRSLVFEKNSDPDIFIQFKYIDFNRGIKLLNTGSGNQISADTSMNRNIIYAATDCILLADTAVKCVKKDLDMMKKIVTIPEQNTGEVR